MPQHKRHTATKTNSIIVLSIIVIAVLGASVYHVRDTRAFVDATTHQPERYSELYFNNPTSIPANVVRGKQLPVSFTIHNVEARNMSYTYDVSFITVAGKTLVGNRQGLELGINGSKAITEDITIPQYLGKAEVRVLLPNLKQSIDFWVQTR